MTDDDNNNPNARLIPPPMEERPVQVRFRFIGEELPRVWTDEQKQAEATP